MTCGKRMGKSWDVADAFRSEVRQGERGKAKNLAVILTNRLMSWALGLCSE